MRNRIIEAIEQEHYRKDVPKFEIGDTVSVGVRIIEGTKERIQPFIGTVIAVHGKGMNQTFTVRRIVANEGVERVFPIQSPRVVGVEVIRHGKVRRGKLFYLRDRVGKSRKLRERRMGADEAGDSGESAPAGAASRGRSAEAAVATV
ncbi:50S ribosomal protein L19 [Phycisphaerae bacterium RAS2]|nr:50S ribosomal protein L19 [Phycisphaerae bacterium RAS2]